MYLMKEQTVGNGEPVRLRERVSTLVVEVSPNRDESDIIPMELCEGLEVILERGAGFVQLKWRGEVSGFAAFKGADDDRLNGIIAVTDGQAVTAYLR